LVTKNEYILEKYRDIVVTDELPFDYYMIFTGLKTDTKNVEQHQKV
jgi:hypothetical protein